LEPIWEPNWNLLETLLESNKQNSSQAGIKLEQIWKQAGTTLEITKADWKSPKLDQIGSKLEPPWN